VSCGWIYMHPTDPRNKDIELASVRKYIIQFLTCVIFIICMCCKRENNDRMLFCAPFLRFPSSTTQQCDFIYCWNNSYFILNMCIIYWTYCKTVIQLLIYTTFNYVTTYTFFHSYITTYSFPFWKVQLVV
jgi:hypothetical protein